MAARTDLDSIMASWRARAWRSSPECQYLVCVILARKARGLSCQSAERVIQVLAASVPPFLMPSLQEAFFATLQDHSLATYDNDLRESVWTFLVKWPATDVLATVADIRADPCVLATAARLLPEQVSLSEWLERRMHEEIELRAVTRGRRRRHDCDERIVHLTREGLRIVVEKYTAMHHGHD